MRPFVTFAAAALLLAGCAPDGAGPTGPAPTPEPTPAASPAPSPEPTIPPDDVDAGHDEVVPAGRDGLADVFPRPFDAALASGTEVVVQWAGAVEPCEVLADVDVFVDADHRQVVVTLHSGHRPDADGNPPQCVAVARNLQHTLHLGLDVDGWQVVDGSALAG